MLAQIVEKSGVTGASVLLSVPVWIVNDWLGVGTVKREWAMRQKDRKLIWLMHALLFNPRVLASPFHVATFGRFWVRPYVGHAPLKESRRLPKKRKRPQPVANWASCVSSLSRASGR